MNTKQCNIYVNNKFALANILEHFLLGDSDFHQGQLEDLERFYQDHNQEHYCDVYPNDKGIIYNNWIERFRKHDVPSFDQYTECIEAIKLLEQVSETYGKNPPVEFLRLKYLLNLTNIKYWEL